MNEQAPLTAPRAALPKTTGVAGLATVILLFGAQGFIQVGGGEPAFDAPAGTVAEFFEARDEGLFTLGAYLTVLGLVAFLWFLGGVYVLLRDHEWPRPWRATIALVSGVAFVASVMAGGWQLAVFRVDEGLDPQLARFVFDLGNLSFANGWVALGSFALASGWVMLSSGAFPRWLGWLAVVAGVGLVVARAVWTTPVWFVPYTLLWLWVIVLSVLLLRRWIPRPE
jgi:hypothetical protein